MMRDMSNRLHGTGPITIADIARDLGLSKSTVSRVLSGNGRISNETKQRVLDYVAKSGYKPNIIAKSLAVSKTFNIGVVVPGDSRQRDMPYFQSCLIGITDCACNANYDVLLNLSNDNSSESVERLLYNRKVDGVILTRLHENDLRVMALKKANIPFVVIGSSDDSEVIQVDLDNQEACKTFTVELLDRINQNKDCKFTFICGNENILVNRFRLAGFLAGMNEKGVSPDDYKVYSNINSGLEVAEVLQKAFSEPCNCIICGDDFLCVHVLTWLHKNGYKIPTDVKVAAFYNSSLLNQNEPQISAINIDARKTGFAACKLLLQVLKKEPVEQRNSVDYELFFRESTL